MRYFSYLLTKGARKFGIERTVKNTISICEVYV